MQVVLKNGTEAMTIAVLRGNILIKRDRTSSRGYYKHDEIMITKKPTLRRESGFGLARTVYRKKRKMSAPHPISMTLQYISEKMYEGRVRRRASEL